MTIHVPISPPSDLPHVMTWRTTYERVNAWRGMCLHHMSMVETAVTETLICLSEAQPTNTAMRLRHLIGQRFEDLSIAFAPSGGFELEGKSAAVCLAHYRSEHEAFRTMLCHGSFKVTLERNGAFCIIITNLTFRGGKAVREVQVWSEDDAKQKVKALAIDAQRLIKQLANLRGILGN